MLLARPVRALLAAALAAASVAGLWLLVPDETRAAPGLELGIQDDALFVQGNKRWRGDRSFQYAKAIGATRIRVNLLWAYSMPNAQSSARRRPQQIHDQFTQIDNLIDAARTHGIRVHVTLSGPSPRWANVLRSTQRSWYKPNPREFGEFAGVVARHFKGRVDRYSIWNEPNWKTWLGPLAAAPHIYRELYIFRLHGDQARGQEGQGADRRDRARTDAPACPPRRSFLRKVTCVNRNYRRTRGCPRMKADGYAHHPYDFKNSPTYRYPGGDNVTMGTLSRLTNALDRLQRSGALRFNGGGRMPVYLTEYGYFASGYRALSAEKRARYLQQAYSMALRNTRVKGHIQYMLLTLQGNTGSTFNTGLVSGTGTRSVQYNALARWYRANRNKIRRPGRAFRLPARRANPSL